MSRILLSHGAGGREMTALIDRSFCPGTGPRPGDDSATVLLGSHRLAFTTDSFVVDPLFFPGGDIGRLAVAGTVNDLLTAAARPLALSASFILEEGLEIDILKAIAASMQQTAAEGGVTIVTGDTKVVPKGSADKVFITTAGVGLVLRPGVSGAAARPGGPDHPHRLGGRSRRRSDAGPGKAPGRRGHHQRRRPPHRAGPETARCRLDVHTMRDPTRGGIAASLNEIARQSQVAMEIDEARMPVNPAVAAACEALGLDVFKVANEGKMLIIVAPEDASRALFIPAQPLRRSSPDHRRGKPDPPAG